MSSAKYMHVWHYCHWCNAAPIRGLRYSCLTCPVGPDNDFCASCYAKFRLGYLPRSETPEPSRHLQHTFHSYHGEDSLPYHAWLDVPQDGVDPPHVPKGFLVRPEFQADRHTSFGGYGFVVEHVGDHLFFTALHVLDEMSKLLGVDSAAETYAGDELPRLIERVILYDVLEEKWLLHPLGVTSSGLVLRGARSGDDEPYSHRDMCAFRVDNVDKLVPGRLAQRVPEVGEAVWLAARMEGDRRTRRAVVVEYTERTFIFRYDDGGQGLGNESGAPILNAAGEVVAINAGSGAFAEHRFGHASHVASIRRHLTESEDFSPGG